jgi:quercetin dioxygenase-like cupin family protein
LGRQGFILFNLAAHGVPHVLYLANLWPCDDADRLTKEITTMDIYACGSRPTRRGPAESFTGTVWQEPIVEAPAPARVRSGLVRFEPGARTAWHTHPLGQTLFVVSGAGRVQTFGGKVREIKAGDVVWIPPNEKHWHGAAPTTSMVHIATQEALDGKHVTWMEHVSDEQYKAASAIST